MDAGDEGFSGKTVRRPESGRQRHRPKRRRGKVSNHRNGNDNR